jgi:tight adherence protein B
MNTLFLSALFVGFTIFCLFASFQGWWRRKEAIEQRLAPVAVIVESTPPRRHPLSNQINQYVGNWAVAARVERQLVAANVILTVGEYWLIQAGCILLGFIGGWFVSGQFFGGLLLAAIGWALPGFILQRRRISRSNAFADQLPDMLSLLVGSLRAGYGLMHACLVIQQEMPDPMASEFAQTMRETRLGYSINEALAHLVERIANEDLELVVASIQIQNEVGGSLADVLDSISETIRERIKIKAEIHTMTSQQRMTGWLMSGMPILLAIGMTLLNPDYMMGMFHPDWLFIPIGALIMIVIGNIVMRIVVRIEV